MVDITALKQAVYDAEQYLLAVNMNLPCGGSCSGFSGAATVNENFRLQREKDFISGTQRLEAAKLALEQGTIQLKNEIQTETNKNIIPNMPKDIITETNKNIIPNMPKDIITEIQKPSNSLLILGGLILASVILLK